MYMYCSSTTVTHKHQTTQHIHVPVTHVTYDPETHVHCTCIYMYIYTFLSIRSQKLIAHPSPSRDRYAICPASAALRGVQGAAGDVDGRHSQRQGGGRAAVTTERGGPPGSEGGLTAEATVSGVMGGRGGG